MVGNFAAEGAFFYLVDEIFDNRQRYVRFQKRQPHFAQGVFDIVFAQARLAADVFENFAKTLGKVV